MSEGDCTVAEMVIMHLKTAGFDGLFNDTGECGCCIGDLFPCDNWQGGFCRPAYQFDCHRCTLQCICPETMTECDFMYSSNPNYCAPHYK